ncbi:hypothetical protein, partial [Vibrio crassostreae]|uniref:hypothetical protein n=1 Tax=Vibrio crassostreae TaxID=246167 RepID=UPI001B3004F4
MANKFFLITCKSKKTKHREGEVTIAFPLTANTQTEAKKIAWETLGTKDEQGTIEFFQVPNISRITEEEYNELLLDNEAEIVEHEQQLDKDWPSLNTSGFYPKETEGLLMSFITQGDNVAQIAILQTAPDIWVFGYRYVTQTSSIAKPTNHAQGEFETIEKAINESVSIISNIAEFQSMHSDGVDKEFATKVINYDFGEDICSQLPDEPTEDQMHIEEQLANQENEKPTLPNQIDVDVAAFNISETKRIELAVMPKGDGWLASFAFTDSANPENDQGNIREFLSDSKSTRENAINLAMGHAGNWLFKVDEVKAAKSFFKGDIAQTFDDGIKHAIVINLNEPKEPLVSQETMDKIKEVGKVFEDKEDDHFIPTNEHELFVYNSLKSIDDAHLDLSPEQYEEAGEKLGAVLKEHETYNAGAYGYTDDHKFNKEKTLSNILEVDWDNSHEAIKVYLNTRSLRALFRENSEFDEPQETPSFQDWSKANKGKSFDDYAEKFNIDSTITTSENVEHPELLNAVIKRMQGEESPATPEQVHNALCTNITDQTDVKALSESVLTLKNVSILWHSTTSVNLIQNHTKHPEQPTYEKVEKPEAKPEVKPEPELFDKSDEWQLYASQILTLDKSMTSIDKPQFLKCASNIRTIFNATDAPLKHGDFYSDIASGFMDKLRGVLSTSSTLIDVDKARELLNETLGAQKVVEQPSAETNELIEVPEQITEQVPANDPIQEVKTIADLPESYRTNPNLALFMQ